MARSWLESLRFILAWAYKDLTAFAVHSKKRAVCQEMLMWLVMRSKIGKKFRGRGYGYLENV